MARTVDVPIILPRQSASGGAEIKHTSPTADTGLQYLARAQNSLYDQHRGVLINDAEFDSEASILGTTAATNLRYRCVLHGNGGLTESAIVGVYAAGNGGAGVGTVIFGDGTNTQTVSVTSVTTAKSWFTNTMTLVDNAEYADISCSYNAGAVGAVYTCMAYYVRTRTTLPSTTAQYYTGTTFCPQDTAQYTANFPLTSAMGYALRDNAAHLWGRCGQAISSSWGNAARAAGSPVLFVCAVPEAVTTLRLYVDGFFIGSGGYSVTTQSETFSGNFTGTRAWTSAIDIDVSGLDVVSVEVDATGSGYTSGVSAYWVARSFPA